MRTNPEERGVDGGRGNDPRDAFGDGGSDEVETASKREGGGRALDGLGALLVWMAILATITTGLAIGGASGPDRWAEAARIVGTVHTLPAGLVVGWMRWRARPARSALAALVRAYALGLIATWGLAAVLGAVLLWRTGARV